jgi:hypothetical protein
MVTGHFLRVLLIFTTLIAIGLLGVFLVSVLNSEPESDTVEGARTIPQERVLAE